MDALFGHSQATAALEPAVTLWLRGAQGYEERDVVGEGAWVPLPGGGRAWRLRIASPGARSQSLVFRRACLACCCAAQGRALCADLMSLARAASVRADSCLLLSKIFTWVYEAAAVYHHLLGLSVWVNMKQCWPDIVLPWQTRWACAEPD